MSKLSDDTALSFKLDNPKRSGSKAYERYDVYKLAKTVKEAIDLGATKADVDHDVKKGFCAVLDGAAVGGPTVMGVVGATAPAAAIGPLAAAAAPRAVALGAAPAAAVARAATDAAKVAPPAAPPAAPVVANAPLTVTPPLVVALAAPLVVPAVVAGQKRALSLSPSREGEPVKRRVIDLAPDDPPAALEPPSLAASRGVANAGGGGADRLRALLGRDSAPALAGQCAAPAVVAHPAPVGGSGAAVVLGECPPPPKPRPLPPEGKPSAALSASPPVPAPAAAPAVVPTCVTTAASSSSVVAKPASPAVDLSFAKLDGKPIKFIKRVSGEAKRLLGNQEDAKSLGYTFHLKDRDNLSIWGVKLTDLNPDGNLAKGLAKHKLEASIDLEISLPDGFPMEPPFARVVYPQLSGGYVFHHGGICFEPLTAKGWVPSMTLPALAIAIKGILDYGEVRVAGIGDRKTRTVPHYTEEGARKDHKVIVSAHRGGESSSYGSLKHYKS